jgi:hypothetical protein
MLLVTFHGGSSGLNNISAYSTPDGTLVTQEALDKPKHLSELRAMVLANGLLYVADGAKSESTVLAYTVPSSGTSFKHPSTLIGPVLDNGQFTTSIAHPFGIVFASPTTCYISNQDTNVVSQLNVSGGGRVGSLASGCQSAYLNKLFPSGTFLDGTYVASQVGSLPDVSVETTVVDHDHGGLSVSLEEDASHKDKMKIKVQNSVRDVAVANGMLFVCDEPDKVINLYSLADGSYLGCSNRLKQSPTHLAIDNGGLYVSAGSELHWGQLPAFSAPASLALQPIALSPPAGNKIGGISFDDASPTTVYIPFQEGTGDSKKAGGSIYRYGVSQQDQSTLPVLSNGAALVTSLADTPEFVLYWSGGS